MSKILLVDDLRDFKDNRECVIARNSSEALTILKQDKFWDEIWLDHDLGIVEEVGIDNVMRVVDYLSKQAFEGNPIEVGLIYVHTSNPVGGKQIMLSLQNFGYNCVRVNAPDFFIVS